MGEIAIRVMMSETKNVAVLIYPGVELLDMNGPIDTFVKTNYYKANRYNVFTVAESVWDVKSERSVVLMTPQYTLSNCPQPDIIVIPGQVLSAGGYGSGSVELITWIKEQARNADTIIMSVCVGAYILCNTGLLAGRRATTHYAAIETIQLKYPDIDFVKNVRYEVDGRFVTTGGVTSGIDGALHVVHMQNGPEIARKVANVMVYNTEAPLPPDTILP